MRWLASRGDNSGYEGPFTTSWGSTKVAGGFVAVSSGGLKNPVPNRQVVVVGGSTGQSAIPAPAGGVSTTYYTSPLSAGKSGFNAEIDLGFFLARQVCR